MEEVEASEEVVEDLAEDQVMAEGLEGEQRLPVMTFGFLSEMTELNLSKRTR